MFDMDRVKGTFDMVKDMVSFGLQDFQFVLFWMLP